PSPPLETGRSRHLTFASAKGTEVEEHDIRRRKSTEVGKPDFIVVRGKEVRPHDLRLRPCPRREGQEARPLLPHEARSSGLLTSASVLIQSTRVGKLNPCFYNRYGGHASQPSPLSLSKALGREAQPCFHKWRGGRDPQPPPSKSEGWASQPPPPTKVMGGWEA
ncbi:hypothetical protein GW17_00022453, partial [Ensete ventricosum]